MQHLPAMLGDTMEEDGPFIFMDADLLESERQVIEAALPTSAGNDQPGLPAELAIQVAVQFVERARYGEPPTVAALRNALAPLPLSQSLALQRRLQQVRGAIYHGRNYQGRDYDPTRLFAVNPRWNRRWETMLSGVLFPAYIGYLDVGQF
jgi:hypothetical protein